MTSPTSAGGTLDMVAGGTFGIVASGTLYMMAGVTLDKVAGGTLDMVAGVTLDMVADFNADIAAVEVFVCLHGIESTSYSRTVSFVLIKVEYVVTLPSHSTLSMTNIDFHVAAHALCRVQHCSRHQARSTSTCSTYLYVATPQSHVPTMCRST
jgi:hypothetical protein